MNFYQDFFFRGLDFLRGRRTIERLHFLRHSQHWPTERLRNWQLDRLNELLVHAKTNSAYYSEMLRAFPLPLKDLSELAGLPVLAKQAIRERFSDIPCRNIPKSRFHMNRTGGSTGEPTYYYWDKRAMDWNRASVYRSAEWGGVALGERTVQMSGSHFDYSQSQKLMSQFVYFLQRYRDYSVAFLTDELLERYYQGIREWKPSSLWGYASGLAAFSSYVATRHPGASLDFVRAIATSSETLRPDQRKTIESVFGEGKVFDQYGSREMYIGSECRFHCGYHLHADVVFLEVVNRENQPCSEGELGRILVTDLFNHAFPFIRYEIGDMGMPGGEEPCQCGVALPRLARVEGRIADIVVLPDRILTPPNFTIIMSDKPGLKAYQIRQDSRTRLEVLLLPSEDFSPDLERYIGDSIRQMTGPGIDVDIRVVNDIPVPESGKRRYIISTVSQEDV